ncbi:ribbon-helix-helix protein, CopG family [Candidatus Shapirobacteria bacterium]|nr:ribbon-helix-helix protein, CopG family [Candidatus Shapirobacteria bacterium]
MIQTINLSLPVDLAQKIDQEIKKEGYVSRSEFFRTLVRFYFLLGAEEFLVPFRKKPLTEIKKALDQEGHPPAFVKSVVAGFKKSSLYQ